MSQVPMLGALAAEIVLLGAVAGAVVMMFRLRATLTARIIKAENLRRDVEDLQRWQQNHADEQSEWRKQFTDMRIFLAEKFGRLEARMDAAENR